MSVNKIIVAIDENQMNRIVYLIDELSSEIKWVKVGMEAYFSLGPSLIEYYQKKGLKIFLDLKLFDIPTTVAKSIATLAKMNIDILNIHAQGGYDMMARAKEALLHSSHPPLLIAVTKLTSTDEKEAQSNSVLLAQEAYKAGLDGVVASALDAKLIKEKTHSSFKIISPGIRASSDLQNDQQRTMSAHDALKNGADYLVIGRPITAAHKPREAFQNIIQGINI